MLELELATEGQVGHGEEGSYQRLLAVPGKPCGQILFQVSEFSLLPRPRLVWDFVPSIEH